jgi:hypothetical protein
MVAVAAQIWLSQITAAFTTPPDGSRETIDGQSQAALQNYPIDKLAALKVWVPAVEQAIHHAAFTMLDKDFTALSTVPTVRFKLETAMTSLVAFNTGKLHLNYLLTRLLPSKKTQRTDQPAHSHLVTFLWAVSVVWAPGPDDVQMDEQQDAYVGKKLLFDSTSIKAPSAVLSVLLMAAAACELQRKYYNLSYDATRLVKQLLITTVNALLDAIAKHGKQLFNNMSTDDLMLLIALTTQVSRMELQHASDESYVQLFNREELEQVLVCLQKEATART